MAWVVADRADDRRYACLTLSEEVTGFAVKSLVWPASLPTLSSLHGVALEILGVRLEFTTTSTVGDRRPLIELRESESDVTAFVFPASVVPASTSRIFEFAAGFLPATDAVELAGTVVRSALPRRLSLQPGALLSILQDPLVDLDDTMIVHVRARVRRR